MIGKKIMSYTLTSKHKRAANELVAEKEFWLRQLSGEIESSKFPSDKKSPGEAHFASYNFNVTVNESALYEVTKGIESRLFIVLSSVLMLLLQKCTGSKDIIIGTPIHKQESYNDLLNTIIPIRCKIDSKITFRKLLTYVKETFIESEKNSAFPLTTLFERLEFNDDGLFPLFDVGILFEDLHEKSYISQAHSSVLFNFSKNEGGLSCAIEYNNNLYTENTIISISNYFNELLKNVISNIDMVIGEIEYLPKVERDYLYKTLNSYHLEYPKDTTIHEHIESQAEKTPTQIAIQCDDDKINYKELNKKANQLSRLLLSRGISNGDVVGILMERSIEAVVAMLAVLKSGASYLPIDIDLPPERIRHMLEDSGSKLILTNKKGIESFNYTFLMGFEETEGIEIIKNPIRSHIKEFNKLPIPDRSLLNLSDYCGKIGMASVTNCISLQTTRGCPYKCLYCHKIWSKSHVHRSGENIFEEINYYYKGGVKNFAVIDDCFNLNIKESTALLRKIVDNKLDIQLFFPNGLRGDIMTPDYIDLMREAGTRGINLSLETASPRLQKLLQKNLNLDMFKNVVGYIASKHPDIILEMATMHGFPTETEEEAMMTLDFIKDIKWLHFPYIHILKIFPNTEMEDFALANGIRKEDILVSKDRAFHELPETLPFSKSFTRKYQSKFLNDYFLNHERLLKVLPYEIDILNETALIQKYNAYLPVEIKTIKDIFDFAGIDNEESQSIVQSIKDVKEVESPIVFNKTFNSKGITSTSMKKILFIDLSQHFSSHSMLYKVVEQPLGLLYLSTYIKEQFEDRIDGKVIKSGVDFDNFEQLHDLIQEYQPDLIGIRTLTFYKEFFHETVSTIRNWGVVVPVFAGGPYVSSDYDTILKDKNVDIAFIGEGEYTLEEFLNAMFANDFKIPGEDVLQGIAGIAYVKSRKQASHSREVVILDHVKTQLTQKDNTNVGIDISADDLAYVLYTSGSTGLPKGVMVEHRNVNNCIFWMDKEFGMKENEVMAQRTNLTFDPSVFEIYWPLYKGAQIRIIGNQNSKDVNFLIKLLSSNSELTKMYCTSSMLTAMTHVLDQSEQELKLNLPQLFIGAEPISKEVICNFYQYLQGKIINTYGPTEGTINNTFCWLNQEDLNEIVPIGKSIANNQVYILSDDLQHRPTGFYGEICIAGDSITRGYINNESETRRVFIDNPFGEGKLYKTGDIGRRLRNGDIQINGRKDEQVKIRGYRIELGEVKNALIQHENINDCIVISRAVKEDKKKVEYCKKCGISTHYPDIILDESSICNLCISFNYYEQTLRSYFKTIDDLVQLVKEQNEGYDNKYDCILLYNGGRGSGYALYQLVNRGIKVLTITYNNGYFSKADIKNIKYVTSSLGVNNVVLTHDKSDSILKESLKSFSTVCRGCFHVSSSLAGEYAYKENIKVVIGATLSRGQIIENKLNMFLKEEENDISKIESQILSMQKSTPGIDKSIFDIIDIEEINSGRVHDKVKFMDFYRFCEITNEDMISFLNNTDDYWKKKKEYAIYSTNCAIKGIGDYGFMKDQGIHYYGAATSWEKRIGHMNLKNVEEDLNCKVSEQAYKNFLKRLGLSQKVKIEESENYLCTYYVANNPKEGNELSSNLFREYLLKSIPEYMVPSYFVELSELPLTLSGKIDIKKLPSPQNERVSISAKYVAPGSKMEQEVEKIWKEVLKLEKIGVNDNFFDLGGNSLKLVLVNSKLNEFLKEEIPVVNLFTYTTIKDLANYLDNNKKGKQMDSKTEKNMEAINDGKALLRTLSHK